MSDADSSSISSPTTAQIRIRPVEEVELSDAFRGLTRSIDELIEAQRTVLRLVDYLVARDEEIDNVRSRVHSRVRNEYPDIDEDIVTTFLNGMDTILSPPPGEDVDTAPIAERIQAAVAHLPEGYSPVSFISALSRAQVQEPSAKVLLRSLLVSMVGTFEVHVATVARILLQLFPASLESSDRSYTWKEVAEHESLDVFREVVFEKAIDDLMRESASGWFKWFDSKFKIATPASVSGIPFREAFQRRHIIVHNGGKVSRLYLENLRDTSPLPELGESLDVDSEYLRSAADSMLVAGVALAARTGFKVLKDEERERFENALANFPYRMLQDGRYQTTHDLSSELRSLPVKGNYVKLVTQVNQWLALKRLGRFEECRDDVTNWDTSTLAGEFQLARYALLDEFEAGHALVKKIRGSDHLTIAFWHTWPLLAELRAYERDLTEPGLHADQQGGPTEDPESEYSDE